VAYLVAVLDSIVALHLRVRPTIPCDQEHAVHEKHTVVAVRRPTRSVLVMRVVLAERANPANRPAHRALHRTQPCSAAASWSVYPYRVYAKADMQGGALV
jgi:hypothetical protein